MNWVATCTNPILKYFTGYNNFTSVRRNNQWQYYLFNAHGDVIQRTDHYGGILKSYDYDAFGVEKNPEKLDSNPFRFCGEYWDSDTETLYLRARYYDPNIGRFGAEDIARDGLNWYTYCGNNPLMFIDPSGLAATTLAKLVKSTMSKVVSFVKSVFSSNSSSSSKSSSSKSTAVTSNTSLQYKAASVPKTGPGAQFNSADAAAKDFGKYIGQDSIENDWEYGTYIY